MVGLINAGADQAPRLAARIAVPERQNPRAARPEGSEVFHQSTLREARRHDCDALPRPGQQAKSTARPALPMVATSTPGPMVGGVPIRQDAAGRFSLNDLHRAAGGEKRHGPSYWLANAQTRALIAELSDTGIPVSTSRGGVADDQGTYVVRELVYAYAMWISPRFSLQVIRAYDAMVAKPSGLNAGNLTRLELLRIAMQAEEERVSLEAEVSALAPKAAALERIAQETDGARCLRESAKLAQVPERMFTEFMRSVGWIFKHHQGGDWLPYADKEEAGLLEAKRVPYERQDGSQGFRLQTLVTPRGLTKIALLIERKAPHLRKRPEPGGTGQLALPMAPAAAETGGAP